MTTSKPTIPRSVVLVVYGREHCHLCQDMVVRLHELQARLLFQLEVVDIDSNAELVTRYGKRVPVLAANGEEICDYHLDPIALDAYFSRIR